MSTPREVVRSVLRTPTWPGTLERAPARRNIGLDYATEWTRRPAAKVARAVLLDGVAAPLLEILATPTVVGGEILERLDAPVIFAANHTSHLDTTLILSALPRKVRRRTVVAAAADYFFDRPWKAAASSLLLGAIPVERTRVNRQSADIAAALIEDGWSLVIFPEGGRSSDGWGQEFRGGAAYLAKRCGVPVLPIHLDGVRAILPKGATTIRPGKVTIRFGTPMQPLPATADTREEDARHFALRVERAVAVLADEAESDWWSARRRAADDSTPSFRGPATAPWRRAWALPPNRRQRPRAEGSSDPW